MRTSSEKDRGDYNPTEIEGTYTQIITGLRQKLESATDPEQRAGIQENIDLLKDDMKNLRSEM